VKEVLPRFLTLGAVVVLIVLFAMSVVSDLRDGSPGSGVTFLLGGMVGAALGLNQYRQKNGNGK
jgi:hypothetical protein